MRGSIGMRSVGSLASEDAGVLYGSESLEDAKRLEAARLRKRNHTVGHSQAAAAVEDFEREKTKREEAAGHRQRLPTIGHSQAAAAVAEFQQQHGTQSQSSVPEEPGSEPVSPAAREGPAAPAAKQQQRKNKSGCTVS
jgi:hypothetical protein